jgi:23S rRNA (uracil1939-C5)-methyltransferase
MNVELELTIERPVPGGDMLARHDGRIIFVSGAIPGERVRATVVRRKGDVTWAHARTVLEASPDRVEVSGDPRCGGRSLAHIRYERQLSLKSEIVGDAFRRIARHTLPEPTLVAASPAQGYRMRARLHVQKRRIGFLREGTHQLCEAGPVGQLTPAALDAVDRFCARQPETLDVLDSILVSETATGDARVLVCEVRDGASFDDWIGRSPEEGVTGVVVMTGGGRFLSGGTDVLLDGSRRLPGDVPSDRPDVEWRRRGASFFQANRFLVGHLLDRVLAEASAERFVDLYAGVGLFSVPMAARGQQGLAVEGDDSSAEDLQDNAKPFASTLAVRAGAVEGLLGSAELPATDVVIVDPPRTGLSSTAIEGLTRWAPARIVYVSCDVATLARDAGRLLGSGYQLRSIEALDMFPHTPHIETLCVFTR